MTDAIPALLSNDLLPKQITPDSIRQSLALCAEAETKIFEAQSYLFAAQFVSYFHQNPEATLFVMGATGEYNDSGYSGCWVSRVDAPFAEEVSYRAYVGASKAVRTSLGDDRPSDAGLKLLKKKYAGQPSGAVADAVRQTVETQFWRQRVIDGLLQNLKTTPLLDEKTVASANAEHEDRDVAWEDILPAGFDYPALQVHSFSLFCETSNLDSVWENLAHYEDEFRVGYLYTKKDLPQILSACGLRDQALISRMESESLKSIVDSQAENSNLTQTSSRPSRKRAL